jgi:hypothetical protein
MTSMEESPVRTPPPLISSTPSNGSLPQSRSQSLTPGMGSGAPISEPKSRSPNGTYRPPNGSFSYGMDASVLFPMTGPRRPPIGGSGSADMQHRLPSESDSRPSASGASDSECCGEESKIWVKRADGTDLGQEDDV